MKDPRFENYMDGDDCYYSTTYCYRCADILYDDNKHYIGNGDYYCDKCYKNIEKELKDVEKN